MGSSVLIMGLSPTGTFPMNLTRVFNIPADEKQLSKQERI